MYSIYHYIKQMNTYLKKKKNFWFIIRISGSHKTYYVISRFGLVDGIILYHQIDEAPLIPDDPIYNCKDCGSDNGLTIVMKCQVLILLFLIAHSDWYSSLV